MPKTTQHPRNPRVFPIGPPMLKQTLDQRIYRAYQRLTAARQDGHATLITQRCTAILAFLSD